jgi:hypothetical protein
MSQEEQDLREIQRLARIEAKACELAGVENIYPSFRCAFWLHLTTVKGIEASERFREMAAL